MDVAARGDEFVVRGVYIADEPQRGAFSLMFRSGGLIQHQSLVQQQCHKRKNVLDLLSACAMQRHAC